MSRAPQIVGYARRTVQPKTANYTVALNDVASVIVATGSSSWTLALPAAASVGNGFIFTLKNAGTGRITIDPNGSETINGVLTLGCYRQDSVDIIGDGTAWQALFQSPFSIVEAATTSGAQALLDNTLPSEFKLFTVELDGFEPSVSAALGLRLSVDGGSTFYNTSGNYQWNGSFDSTSTTNSTTYKSTGGIWGSSAIELTPGVQSVASGVSMSSTIKIYSRSAGRIGSVRFDTMVGQAIPWRGAGYLGFSASDVNAFRLVYNNGNIAAGAKYTVIGHRG